MRTEASVAQVSLTRTGGSGIEMSDACTAMGWAQQKDGPDRSGPSFIMVAAYQCLCLVGWLESGAAADRCHHEVKWLVARVTAGLDEIVGSLMPEPDLDQFRLFFRLVLTEVGAHSALSIMELQHWVVPFGRRIWHPARISHNALRLA